MKINFNLSLTLGALFVGRIHIFPHRSIRKHFVYLLQFRKIFARQFSFHVEHERARRARESIAHVTLFQTKAIATVLTKVEHLL